MIVGKNENQIERQFRRVFYKVRRMVRVIRERVEFIGFDLSIPPSAHFRVKPKPQIRHVLATCPNKTSGDLGSVTRTLMTVRRVRQIRGLAELSRSHP